MSKVLPYSDTFLIFLKIKIRKNTYIKIDQYA